MGEKSKPAGNKRRITPYSESTSTVRLSDVVKSYITKRSRYSESIDNTLRRMFKLKLPTNGASPHGGAR